MTSKNTVGGCLSSYRLTTVQSDLPCYLTTNLLPVHLDKEMEYVVCGV